MIILKSINKNITNEIIINKSRFISKIFRVNNEDEVKDKLEMVKRLYKDATHYCYAYIIGNIKRFNDDGEPGGTAGMPILNVLENKELNNILCVVIRYFGGIKLGAGGLVRAYTNSVVEAVNLCDIINLVDGYKIKLEFSYDKVKYIDNLLREYNISYKEYDTNVIYELEIDIDSYNDIEENLKGNCIDIKKIENILVKKSHL